MLGGIVKKFHIGLAIPFSNARKHYNHQRKMISKLPILLIQYRFSSELDWTTWETPVIYITMSLEPRTEKLKCLLFPLHP